MASDPESVARELSEAARHIGRYHSPDHWRGLEARLEGLLGRARKVLWTGPRGDPAAVKALEALRELEAVVTDRAPAALDATQCRGIGQLFERVRHGPGRYK